MTIKYLVHWLKYDSEYNSWVNIKDLRNVKKLIWLYKLE